MTLPFKPAASTTSRRLFYNHLGLNDAVPAHTWVQVSFYLNKLIYDPIYKYFTGFYIKNDAGFRGTVYIDDVK